jgi:TatD DNase family protein
VTGSLVDFHCHLDLFPDFERLVGECDRARVYTLAVTTTPRAWERNRDLCGPTSHVRAALGLHPHLMAEHWREFDLWERHLPETRYVGEVGLDAGPRHFRSLDRQKDVFRRVLVACAAAGGRTLSVHSVRAATAVLDLVEEHLPRERGTVVLHWFSGSAIEAKRAVALGCRFSVNSRMLRTDRGVRLLRSLPRDRLLMETDGPFVEDAGRKLRPVDTAATLEALSTELDWDIEDCRRQILANLRTLVGSPRVATDLSHLPG